MKKLRRVFLFLVLSVLVAFLTFTGWRYADLHFYLHGIKKTIGEITSYSEALEWVNESKGGKWADIYKFQKERGGGWAVIGVRDTSFKRSDEVVDIFRIGAWWVWTSEGEFYYMVPPIGFDQSFEAGPIPIFSIKKIDRELFKQEIENLFHENLKRGSFNKNPRRKQRGI